MLGDMEGKELEMKAYPTASGSLQVGFERVKVLCSEVKVELDESHWQRCTDEARRMIPMVQVVRGDGGNIIKKFGYSYSRSARKGREKLRQAGPMGSKALAIYRSGGEEEIHRQGEQLSLCLSKKKCLFAILSRV